MSTGGKLYKQSQTGLFLNQVLNLKSGEKLMMHLS